MKENRGQVEFISEKQGWYNMWKAINLILLINKIMDKSHQVILLEAEKAFDKIQCPFIIETLHKLGIEGNFVNQIKGVYEHS